VGRGGAFSTEAKKGGKTFLSEGYFLDSTGKKFCKEGHDLKGGRGRVSTVGPWGKTQRTGEGERRKGVPENGDRKIGEGGSSNRRGQKISNLSQKSTKR